MAAKKKKVKKKMIRRGPREDDQAMYAQFIGDLLAGLLGECRELYVSRDGNGKIVLEYDEEVDDN